MAEPCTFCGLIDHARECPKYVVGCMCWVPDSWKCGELKELADRICPCRCHRYAIEMRRAQPQPAEPK